MAATDLAPGTLVGGDFTVETVLAKGGMGVVYVATQKSTRKRRALKVLTPQPGDLDALRRRFEREAHIASQIESDHVVEVIGAGVDAATNAAWMAMELLEGEDLEAYLVRRGRIDWVDGWNIVGELCHALEAAHRIGLIHRDMKPSNVFLARSRRPGVAREVKVLDFGIAKRATDSNKTTGALGTPLYMAPEQTSAGAPVTAATDVWALGLVVFEMFTGVSYWRSANHEGSQMATLLREIIIDPLVPASVRAAELGAQGCLPPEFDAWFQRCVVRDLAERYSDAGDAYRALLPILRAATGIESDGVPPPLSVARPLASADATRAPPPTARAARTQPTFETSSAPGEPRSRLRLLLAGTATGALVVVAGVILALRVGLHGPPPPSAGDALPPRDLGVAPIRPAALPLEPAVPPVIATAEIGSAPPAASSSSESGVSGVAPPPSGRPAPFAVAPSPASARQSQGPTAAPPPGPPPVGPAPPSAAPPAPPAAPPTRPAAPPIPPAPVKDPVIL